MIEFSTQTVHAYEKGLQTKKTKVSPVFFNTSSPDLIDVCKQLNSAGNWITWLIDRLGENYLTSIIIYQICYCWKILPKEIIDDLFYRNTLKEWKFRHGKLRWIKIGAIKERIRIEKTWNIIKQMDGKFLFL